MQVQWTKSDGDFILKKGEVHLWLVSLKPTQSVLDFIVPLLAPEEADRAARFYQTRDCQRFILARGLLRIILGRYLRSKSESLLFSYSQKGKPELSKPITKLNFNLSHSQGYVLYAIGEYREIGIDLEYIKEIEAMEIARRFFNSQDCQYLEESINPQDMFFKLWTAKEAYLKAIGQGIASGLDQVSLTIDQNGFYLNPTWTVHSFTPAEGYYGALACNGDLEKILGFSVTDDLDRFFQEPDHSLPYATDDKIEFS